MKVSLINGFRIQIDSPIMINPNSSLIASKYLPDFGNHFDAVNPITMSGIPKPILRADSATMPQKISPLCPITISVATNGGATHAVTKNAERIPIINTPI